MPRSKPTLEIFILAGGLSSRMGRDKSRIRIGRRSILRHVRDAASQLGHPIRVIRRDAAPRCGPLGGILTALQRTRADAVLLLAYDMPFITPELLKRLIQKFPRTALALFAHEADRAGFPCLLLRETKYIVAQQIAKQQFSLQSLAKKLRAKTFHPPRKFTSQLVNLNTPEDLERARYCQHPTG